MPSIIIRGRGQERITVTSAGVSPEVADGPRSVILDQVQNGVAVRMAILYLLAGGVTADGAEGTA